MTIMEKFDSMFPESPKEWGELVKSLPMPFIWTDGDAFFCNTEECANALANWIEGKGICERVITGYYDPDEDATSGMVDKYTGWWYVEA